MRCNLGQLGVEHFNVCLICPSQDSSLKVTYLDYVQIKFLMHL